MSTKYSKSQRVYTTSTRRHSSFQSIRRPVERAAFFGSEQAQDAGNAVPRGWKRSPLTGRAIPDDLTPDTENASRWHGDEEATGLVSSRIFVRTYRNLTVLSTTPDSSHHPEDQLGGKRSSVTSFSKAARRRMLQAMNAWTPPALFYGAFITLTYPDNFPENPETWKRDLNAFKKRLLRRFHGAQGFWRQEHKRRKSGQNEGKVAPHFHLLIYYPTQDWRPDTDLSKMRAWVSRNWYQVVGSEDMKHLKAGTNVRRLKSIRHATSYVSKYAAKLEGDDVDQISAGRRWGYIGSPDILPEMYATLPEDAAAFILAKVAADTGSEYARQLLEDDRKAFFLFVPAAIVKRAIDFYFHSNAGEP